MQPTLFLSQHVSSLVSVCLHKEEACPLVVIFVCRHARLCETILAVITTFRLKHVLVSPISYILVLTMSHKIFCTSVKLPTSCVCICVCVWPDWTRDVNQSITVFKQLN